jgi:hypothetical protein
MNPFIIAGEPGSAGSSCYSVNLGSVKLHFSYKTLIGVHVFPAGVTVTPHRSFIRAREPGGFAGEQSYRVENAWGPTTGRHMKALGLEHAAVKTEAELQELVRGALFADVVASPLNHGE